jgi:hypothetical protein
MNTPGKVEKYCKSSLLQFSIIADQVQKNRCYYGEFPLSFAASVGSVEMCKMLCETKAHRIENPDEFEKEGERRFEQRFGKPSTPPTVSGPSPTTPHTSFRLLHLIAKGKKAGHARRRTNSMWNNHHSIETQRDPMWRFLNACDTFGNTAMHMAVLHRRKDVVDWIMTTEQGRDSLDILNFDGFTPLTLAARHGSVEMFRHILYVHMSEVAWKYGKVREPRPPRAAAAAHGAA